MDALSEQLHCCFSSNEVAALIVAERHAQGSEAARKMPTEAHREALIQ
jgi:hypothetical protein